MFIHPYEEVIIRYSHKGPCLMSLDFENEQVLLGSIVSKKCNKLSNEAGRMKHTQYFILKLISRH